MVEFNGKIYNEEVFLDYLAQVPRTEFDELLKSGALVEHPEYAAGLTSQVGGNFITVHLAGRLDATTALNYDGNSDLDEATTFTYEQGVIVIGRAGAWTEYDFSKEMTQVDFMEYVVALIAEFREDVDEADLLAILKGISGVEAFANHIYEANDVIGATTINTAIQKACGDLKNQFAIFVCHSGVATQLENLQLLEYWKYTDANGITRNLALGTVNGKTCIIDDRCPYENGVYTSYVLGRGAIAYCDIPVKVAIETNRDPKTKGGVDMLYYRWRKILAPVGFNFVKDSLGTASPTADELATSGNWTIIPGSQGAEPYPEKAIPICIIKTLDAEPEDSGEGVEKTSVSSTSTKKATTTTD